MPGRPAGVRAGSTVVITMPLEHAAMRTSLWRLLIAMASTTALVMGFCVMRAESLKSANFTALSELPGWPETWGLALMVFGGTAVVGRYLMTRTRCGWVVATGGMVATSLWYAVFAASLLIGTAQYGYVPYIFISGVHMLLASFLVRTRGSA